MLKRTCDVEGCETSVEVDGDQEIPDGWSCTLRVEPAPVRAPDAPFVPMPPALWQIVQAKMSPDDVARVVRKLFACAAHDRAISWRRADTPTDVSASPQEVREGAISEEEEIERLHAGEPA